MVEVENQQLYNNNKPKGLKVAEEDQKADRHDGR